MCTQHDRLLTFFNGMFPVVDLITIPIRSVCVFTDASKDLYLFTRNGSFAGFFLWFMLPITLERLLLYVGRRHTLSTFMYLEVCSTNLVYHGKTNGGFQFVEIEKFSRDADFPSFRNGWGYPDRNYVSYGVYPHPVQRLIQQILDRTHSAVYVRDNPDPVII